MDGALNSSRYGDAAARHNDDRRRRGGRGRGGYYGGGGRRRPYHPYGGGRGRSRPARSSPGNRFSSSTTTSTKSIDQKTAMMQQLSAMVSRVGDTAVATEGGESSSAAATRTTMIAKNITDLAKVLCKPENAVLFLEFAQPQNDATVTDAKQEAGHLAHLVVSCALALPLRTPTYAGVTLAIQEHSPKPTYDGFARRCVTYAMQIFCQELDTILLLSSESCTQSVLRIQHLLRYLALLGKVNIVLGHDEKQQQDDTSSLSLSGLLLSLVTAARNIVDKNKTVAYTLVHIILSTVPYVLGYIPAGVIQDQIVGPLETYVLVGYKSTFWPGLGKHAILLKQEQTEDEDEEEEDEEESDDDEEVGQRCDTLQDLLRTVKTLLLQNQHESTTNFTLLSDAPWLELVKPQQPPDSAVKAKEGDLQEEEMVQEEEPLVNTDEPLRLVLSPNCRSIPYLLSANDDPEKRIEFTTGSFDGIVVGRLPMFGGPASDDDEDEDGNDAAAPNLQLEAYRKNFNAVDRFFLSDAIRDCLLSHKSTVSDSGLERGSANDTAKQILDVGQVFSHKEPKSGIEYGIIETILSLVVQSRDTTMRFYLSRILTELTRLRNLVMPNALVVGVSNLVQDYLPSLVPRARQNLSSWFAFHLENTDYQWPAGYWELWIPYGVQQGDSRGEFVRRALGVMASHMSSISTVCTNCLPPKCSFTDALLLLSLLEKKEDMDNTTAPKEQQKNLREQPEEEHDAMISVQQDLELRVWDMNEDPDQTRAYMVGDEVEETIAGSQKTAEPWWRTKCVLRALLRPAKKQHDRMIETVRQSTQKVEGGVEDNMMVDDSQREESKHDVMTDVTDVLVRYKQVLWATLERDNADSDKSPSLPQIGESHVLMQLEEITRYSRVILMETITCMLRNGIVSPMGILRWTLRDFGDTEPPQQDSVVDKQWWEFAEMALSVELQIELKKDTGGVGGDIGMVVDTGGDEDETPESALSKLMNQCMDFASPLLGYAVERVCKMLTAIDSQDGKLRHTPVEVDLIEGMKQIVVYTHGLLVSEFVNRTGHETDSNHSTGDETTNHFGGINTVIANSEINGEKLASACRNQGDGVSPAAEFLAQILDEI